VSKRHLAAALLSWQFSPRSERHVDEVTAAVEIRLPTAPVSIPYRPHFAIAVVGARFATDQETVLRTRE